MSLVPCRECGREVSTKATTCPHCGEVEWVARQAATAHWDEDKVAAWLRRSFWSDTWAGV